MGASTLCGSKDRRSTSCAAFLLVLVALTACSDETGPEDGAPAAIVFGSGTLFFSEIGETAQLDFAVLDSNGDTIRNPSVTFELTDPAVVSVDPDGLVTALRNGATEIFVIVTGTDVTNRVAAVVEAGPQSLDDGVAVKGLSGSRGSPDLPFVFELPESAAGSVVLYSLRGGTGDADLLVRFGQEANASAFDCVSAGQPNVLDNLEFCAMFDAQPGEWYATVVPFGNGFQGVQIQVRVVEEVMLLDGVPAAVDAGGLGDLRFFRFDVPEGTSDVRRAASEPRGRSRASGRMVTFASGSRMGPARSASRAGDLSLTLGGGTGDADLAATFEPNLALTDVGVITPCASLTDATSEEACLVPDASGGAWRVLVLGVGDFTGVSLTAQLGG